MKQRLKNVLNAIISVFMLLLSLVFFAGFGWIALSMTLDKGGFNGQMYTYYDVPAALFCAYYDLVTFIALCFILWIPWLWLKGGRRRFGLTSLIFLLYLIVVVCCQYYLEGKWIGKG